MQVEGDASPASGRTDVIPDLRLAFFGTPLSVRRALARVREACAELGEADSGTVELALAEALNNVVEHAYSDRETGPVNLRLHHDGDAIRVVLRDHGAPMPVDGLPSGIPGDLPDSLFDLPEGGFGWLIIRDLAQDFAYRREGRVNTLTFRIPVLGPVA